MLVYIYLFFDKWASTSLGHRGLWFVLGGRGNGAAKPLHFPSLHTLEIPVTERSRGDLGTLKPLFEIL